MLSPLLSDEALAERLKAGDQAAFTVLYARYYKLSYSICLGVLGRRDQAEEAVQEAFFSAARRLNLVPENFKAWIARISRNSAIDMLRVQQRRISTSELVGGMDEPAIKITTHDELIGKTDLSSVLRGLRELPERQRIAITMRELGGRPLAEIAELLETTADGARDLIRRARHGLRQRRMAEELSCVEVRERLNAELLDGDGRTRPGHVRIHIAECRACNSYRKAAMKEKRALR